MANIANGRISKPKMSGIRRSQRLAKDRKPQKAVLRDRTDNRHNLDTVISFRLDPPPGYTFIPAGNPELTAALKDFARNGDHKIFAVTATSHRHELSKEVHRIGFHFPTVVVAQVCGHYGIRLTNDGRVIDESKNQEQPFMRVYQRGQLVLDEKVQDQVTINTDAKQTIKDLFPKIPDKDLFQIIKTAFQLGQGKVGTAEEITLIRRAQLAVVAHIRHIYTDYDKLLRLLSYNDARHKVEEKTLLKLVEWRGDDDDKDGASKHAVDDVFREVIYISDDEDSDSEVDEVERLDNNHIHVEEIPKRIRGIDNRPTSPIYVDNDDQDLPQGYYRTGVTRRYHQDDERLALRERSRYEAWDRARELYRANHRVEPIGHLDNSNLQPVAVRPRTPISRSTGAERPNIAYHEPHRSRAEEEHHIRYEPTTDIVRGTDGRLYERVSDRPNELKYPLASQSDGHVRYISSRHADLQPAQDRSVNAQSPISRFNQDQYRSNNYHINDTVVPSIEAPQAQAPPSYRPRVYEPNYSSEVQILQRQPLEARQDTSRRAAVIVDAGDATERNLKRRRVEVYPSHSDSYDGADHQYSGRNTTIIGSSDNYRADMQPPFSINRPVREIIEIIDPPSTKPSYHLQTRRELDRPAEIIYQTKQYPSVIGGRLDDGETTYRVDGAAHGVHRVISQPDLRRENMQPRSSDHDNVRVIYAHRNEPVERIPATEPRLNQTRERVEYIPIVENDSHHLPRVRASDPYQEPRQSAQERYIREESRYATIQTRYDDRSTVIYR